jgi:hypothetical protein
VIVGAALILATVVVLVSSMGFSSFVLVLVPVALLATFFYPVSLAFILLVMWCTAPAFEWIELGTVGGFSVRPDYVVIVVMAAFIMIKPRARKDNLKSLPALRSAIMALVLAESISIMVDGLVKGDLRITLLLLVKTLGASVGYWFLRSRLSRQHLVAGLKWFIGLAIIPIATSAAVGITRSSDLFNMFLQGAGTQGEFNTPFGVIPRAFLLGAEPYLLAVFALCLTVTLGRRVPFLTRFLAAFMVLTLILRLPFTWARNLIATYAAILALAFLATWWAPMMRVSYKVRMTLAALAGVILVVGVLITQNIPQLHEALNFTTQRFATSKYDLDQNLLAGRYLAASSAYDALSADPLALFAGYGTRVEFVGTYAIPASDIATPISIWFKFGLIGLLAVIYITWITLRTCRRGLRSNGIEQVLAVSLLLTMAGFWFQTIISSSPFTMTPYATIFVLGILFVFYEIAADKNNSGVRRLL